MIRFVCSHKIALVHMRRMDHRGQGWVGETHYKSLAKRRWWSGLGRGCQEGWRVEAACEECMERRLAGHGDTHCGFHQKESRAVQTGPQNTIFFVFNSETLINLWDFRVLITWER